MENIIGIIGGDLRNIELSKVLTSRGYIVKTYGLLENEVSSVEEFLSDVKYIVAGTPFSRDQETLNLTKEKIEIERFLNRINENQVVFAGSIDKKVRAKAEECGKKVYDLLDDEDMAVLNAIPSAEGAIEIALKSMKTTLHSANSLILGYGRIGKILANILKGFNSNVYVVARKDEDFAWIKANGYIPVKYSELTTIVDKMDVIFNTVPFLVMDENELERVNKNCVIIDLASKPGGINFEKAKALGTETYWALGLPGKVAPASVAIYMADKIISKF